MMLEVTVKTLDSQNHTFSVSEESTVKEFKEQISPVLNISVEKQRLIFCGKVLKDDKKLSEYDVNGKVIHVVQSLPPQGNSASVSSTSGSTSTTNSGPRTSHRDAAGFVLGAFTIPQDLLDPNQVQNIVQEVVSGMGELGRNATVISRNTEDGPSVDFRISLGQVPLQSEAQLRMNQVQTMFIRANRILDFLLARMLLNGPNTGNNSSESSSQTDNDEELRSRLMEADIANVLPGETTGSSRGSGDSAVSAEEQNESTNITQPTEESGNPPPVPERYGLEGLAQVAQAALTAAIATATAAARAATSTLSPQSAPGSEVNNSAATIAGSEPVNTTTEVTSEIRLTPDSPVAMEVDAADSESGPSLAETTQESQTNPSANDTAADNSNQNSGRSTSESADTGLPPREPSQPSVQTLANLLDEVIRINTRLEPCLEKCRDLIRNDAVLTGNDLVDAHRLFSKTSQLLHFLSHAYHSLSDLHVNFAARPPRSPRVRIISSSPTLIQQAIPVQAQINITSSVISPTSNPSTTTTPNTTTATTNTQNDIPAPSASNRGVPLTRIPDTMSSTFSNLHRTGSIPRIPSTSSIPAAVRGSQNPMFYMEVTPGSITIDSISAAMDASLGSLNLPDEDFDASSRDTPTPPTSNASQTENRPESQTSDAQSTAPHTRSYQYLHPGFGPAGPAMRSLIPVPLTSMGGLHTFDSALPCHSVWALEPSRRRHHAGQSRVSSESQRNARVSGVNVSARTANSDSAAPATANESSQPASANATAQPSAPTATTQSSASTGTAASGFQSHISSFLRNIGPNLPIPESISINMQQRLMEDLTNPSFISHILSAVDPMNDLSQTIVLPNQRRSGQDNSNSGTNTAAGSVVSSEQYRTSIEELRSSSSFPFNTTTLAEFFLNNRDLQFQENDIVGPAVYYLCQILTLEDFFEASLGNFSSFNRIKEPLLVYILTKLFHAGNTEEENRAIVDKIVNNLMALMEPVVAHLDIWPGIDYRATMRNFFKHKINVLKNNLSSESVPDTAEFGNYICKMINQIVLEFQYLHSLCCDCGLFAFQSFFNDYVNQVCTGNRAPFRQILLRLGLSLITREPINIDPIVVRSFIVSSTPGFRHRVIAPRRAEASASSRVRNPEQSEIPRHFRSNLIQQTEELVRLLERRTRSHRRTLESQTAAPTVEEVVINSESWHNAVPRDWVPIITRDVQRQRRQAPQPPFGDAYLSGMPSKRRKIMASGAQTLLENSKTTLSDMLQQAMVNADVKPLSSSEQVKKDASENISLQTAFTLHMKNAIQERLQRDLDYCSEKFPNSKKYYM